jgi:hypothetical protein
MTHSGLIEDYDYNATHQRKRFTIWSGPFASVREGEAYSLPKGDGFMITKEYGGKVRVECPVERTSDTYEQQDKAFNEALNRDRLEYLRQQIEAECISGYEVAELAGLAEYIDSADTLLLQWAGVPEFEEDEPAKPFVPNGKRVLHRR